MAKNSSIDTTIEVCAHRVTVRWWDGPFEDLTDRLMEEAQTRTKEMITQGYSSGELCYEDESRSFRGWWEIQR